MKRLRPMVSPLGAQFFRWAAGAPVDACPRGNAPDRGNDAPLRVLGENRAPPLRQLPCSLLGHRWVWDGEPGPRDARRRCLRCDRHRPAWHRDRPPVRVLVAHEPLAYRQALSAALAALRPEAEVAVVAILAPIPPRPHPLKG